MRLFQLAPVLGLVDQCFLNKFSAVPLIVLLSSKFVLLQLPTKLNPLQSPVLTGAIATSAIAPLAPRPEAARPTPTRTPILVTAHRTEFTRTSYRVQWAEAAADSWEPEQWLREEGWGWIIDDFVRREG